MAGGAIGTETFLVYVVRGVAASALAGRIAVQNSRLMAIHAVGAEMPSKQQKIGQFMIKCRLVQVHNIRVAAFMIRVAACTPIRTRSGRFSVKTCLVENIPGDFLVAVETQGPLCRSVERFVAIGALRLDIRVRSHDLAWHHQGFQGLGGDGTGVTKYKHQKESDEYWSQSWHIAFPALVHVYGKYMYKSRNNEHQE